MAILGEFKEKNMTTREYIENEARERVRAKRRGDAGHGYRCRACFLTDDVNLWSRKDYCLYIKYLEAVSHELNGDEEDGTATSSESYSW